MPIRKYKRGRYWWLEGTGPGGSRVHESTRTADEKAAEQLRIRRENDLLDLAIMGEKATYTFAQAVVLYVENGGERRFLMRLVEHFGETLCKDMSGPTVRDAARRIYPKASYTTWNRQVITPVRAVLSCAADVGKCDPVKIKGFTAKSKGVRKSDRPKRVAVDRAYIDRFRAHCGNPHISAMMLFMFQTGARRGDVLKLEWKSVDLDKREVTFADMKNGETETSEITEEMARELGQLPRLNRWVFRYRTKKSLYRHVKATCEAAGLPYLALHQPGRHSFATELVVRAGIDVATAKTLGRWKTARLMTETYVHGRNRGIIEQVFGESGRGDAETVPSAVTSPGGENRSPGQKSKRFPKAANDH